MGLDFAAIQFLDVFGGAHAGVLFEYVEKGNSRCKSGFLANAFECFFLVFSVLYFSDGLIESVTVSVIHETFWAVISEIKGDVVLGYAGAHGKVFDIEIVLGVWFESALHEFCEDHGVFLELFGG
jgi:hypothetical protein